MEAATTRVPDTIREIAGAIARDLVAERFVSVAAHFSGEIAQALPAPTIEAVWRSLIDNFGRCTGLGESAGESQGGVTILRIPVVFETGTLDLTIAFSDQGIVGFRMVPHIEPAAPWSSPAYADPRAFVNREIQVGREPAALPGILTLPVGVDHPPCAILVHGSGPQDRDETVGPNRPFRDLAEGLATKGIAVLRYDKRTKVYPESFASIAAPTVKHETMDDVGLAVDILKARQDIDPERIVVIGHSLGGTLAPRIAAQTPSLAAIVILAGASRPLPDLVVAQIEYLASLEAAPMGDAAAARIDAVKAEASRVRAARPGDEGPAFFGAPLSYWADLNTYDPAEVAAALTIPIQILQGGRDYQVTVDDFDRFRSVLGGHGNVAFGLLPRLNHQFMAGEGRSTPAEYDTPGHVDPEVVDRIAAFVLSV